ncbi:hypothetical protein OPV22_015815 [Ensete ventricosum]|uniref:Uncharacterized protein n=1 Tax=Ensete ventricosum TaxID=4639 RepID=A0AAV8PME2_ENSVE|nr:hypothetical protein OPV22_015815 [Ensete ventricosum]
MFTRVARLYASGRSAEVRIFLRLSPHMSRNYLPQKSARREAGLGLIQKDHEKGALLLMEAEDSPCIPVKFFWNTEVVVLYPENYLGSEHLMPIALPGEGLVVDEMFLMEAVGQPRMLVPVVPAVMYIIGGANAKFLLDAVHEVGS